MIFSNRVNSILSSKTVELDSLIKSLKADGKDIIALNVGEPDFSTPADIKKATINAIHENKTKYGHVGGQLELRKKIADSFEHFPVALDEENVLVANGSKQIIYSVFQTIINPGDEVIVLRPYWVTFPESIKLAGGIPVFVDTKDNFQIDFKKLKEAITSKTKAIIINTPNNPSGAVYPEKDLKEIGKLVCDSNLYLISDEAYDRLVFDNNNHFTIGLSSTPLFQKTITIKTFSKTFCMTGYRIGYMVAPKKVIQAVTKLQSHLTGNNCSFAQYGALAAVDIDDSVIQEMIDSFQKRGNLAHSLFSQIFRCHKPQGAFYLFCDISNYLGDKFKSCDEFSIYLLKEANVALVPGSAFGMPGFLRLSFSSNEEDIKKAFNRIKAIL